MNFVWSHAIAEQISRAQRALASNASPGSKLEIMLQVVVHILEGEGGLIEVAPSDGGPRLKGAKCGRYGQIPAECVAHVMSSGRSIAPTGLDGTPLADESSAGFGPIVAFPLKVGKRIHGVLAVRLDGGPPLDAGLCAAIQFVGYCAAKILASVAGKETAPAGRVPETTGSDTVERPIAGKSAPLAMVFEVISLVSRSVAAVLLLGESGVGKELFARKIHVESGRVGDFHAVNSAAIPDSLSETEWLGCVKGGHSEAKVDRVGHFEKADGGTLFIDEVGDLTLAAQAKLLRVLEEKTFCPVGSSDERKVDVRLVAATNKNLKQMVNAGTFREDLYFRLAVVAIKIPPLRDRREDIPLIVELILGQAPEELNLADASPIKITPGAMDILKGYSWSGNVRQLKNVLHRLVLFNRPLIDEVAVVRALRDEEATPTDENSTEATMKQEEANLIEKRLRENGGRKGATARSLGITRQCLWKKLKGRAKASSSQEPARWKLPRRRPTADRGPGTGDRGPGTGDRGPITPRQYYVNQRISGCRRPLTP